VVALVRDVRSKFAKALLAAGIAVVGALLLAGAALGSSRSWSAPVNLSEAVREGQSPLVAIDAGGDSMAMWGISHGAGLVRRGARPALEVNPVLVQVAVRPDGGAWGAPQTLSNPSFGAGVGAIGTDAAGEAVALWTQRTENEATFGEKSLVEYAIRAPGAGFGTGKALSEGGAEEPTLAVNPGGESLVAWLADEDTEVQYSARSAGGAFGSTTTIKAAAGSTVGEVHAAIDPNGDAILVWDEEEEPSKGEYLSRIEAAQRTGSDAFGSPATLSEAHADDLLPQVAIDAKGDATVLWVAHTEVSKKGEYQVQARTLSASGSKGQVQILSSTAVIPEDPQIADDAAGEGTAAWTLSTESSKSVEADVLPEAGGTFEPAVILAEAKTGLAYTAVAQNEAGEAIVLWSIAAGSEQEQVSEVERAPGGMFLAPLAASPVGVGFDGPALAIDPSGDAAAAWIAFAKETLTVQAANYAVPPTESPIAKTPITSGGTTRKLSPPFTVSISARTIKLAKLLKGSPLTLRCTLSAAGTCRIEVTIATRVARKLGFHVKRGAKSFLLAVGSARLTGAGSSTFTIRPTSSVRRLLRHAHGTLVLSLAPSAGSLAGASATGKALTLTLH